METGVFHSSIARRAGLIALSAWCAGGLLSAAEVQSAAAAEYKLKAVFLYNFAKLVQWPTNAFAQGSAPITIGVLGADPFGPLLEQAVSDRKIGSRSLAVVRFRDLNAVSNCQILFVSASERTNMSSILSRMARKPVLTVGETDGFTQQGGVVGLRKSDDGIQFEINRAAAENASLRLSSKLLRLATNVRSGDSESGGPTNLFPLQHAEATNLTHAPVP